MKLTCDTNILITGCSGMLGDAFFRHFKSFCNVLPTDIRLLDPDTEYLDVCDYSSFIDRASSYKPQVIIHLAAITDQEFCENNPGKAFETNTKSVENAVNVSKLIDATLVYVSTSTVYDGNKSTYNEKDIPVPLGVYGKSKYFGELFIRENMDKYFICRAGWMMGGGHNKDIKFVGKLLHEIQSGSSKIMAVGDKYGSPTYTLDFAKNTHALLETEYYGLYNMVNSGGCSRYEFAEEILNILGLNEKIELKEVNSEYFQSTFFVERPASEVLLNTSLDSIGLNRMRHWKDALKEYIETSLSVILND